MPERPVGVLVMAHGTPPGPEAIGPFYTRIRGGRAPGAEQLSELAARYEAIGGTSPLTAVTMAQVRGVAAALENCRGGPYEVRYGAKHVDPLIEDAATELLKASPAKVVGLVLTPHRSSRGSDEYLARAEGALGGQAEFVAVHQWWSEPGFTELVRDRVVEAEAGSDATVVFTAHSLPERVREAGDPYEDQVRRSAAQVAEAAGLARWSVAFQSAGRTPEPWIGPDLLEVVRRLPEEGVREVVICPIGFVADHLEVLYDIDIEARRAADEVGLTLRRAASLNDDPRLAALLAGVVAREAGAP